MIISNISLPFLYHVNSVIYKEAVCAKDIDFNHVISPVVCCVNVIRFCALNQREFRELFEDEIS
jgi:hypothetical protein